ncbi:MAG TPA: XrtA system polysaccharide chain length determinant [Clostridia bacterium]|nr:XrtA system polysaccharide chain length determinant [Clostridia bacterium]
MTRQSTKELGLSDIWAVAVRRRWWLLVPAFLVWTVVFGVSWFVPSEYKSETVILVEQQKVPEQYVVPNVSSDMQQRLQSMTQQILSRTRLLKIIEDFKLYPSLRGRKAPDELVDRMREDISIELVRAGNRNDLTAFKIYYSASNPLVAQQVTNQLTTLFIDENLRAREQQSQGTTDFLERQVDSARQNLEQQEARLRDFKLRYLGQLPAQLQPNVQILSGLQGQLVAATGARDRAVQQNTYLTSLISQYKSTTSSKDGKDADLSGIGAAASADQQLETLRVQLAELQSRYTNQHPDVLKLQQQISETERLREKMATEPPKFSASDGKITPLAQLNSQLKANQLEIQSTDKEIKLLQGHIAEYQGRLNITPLREQQISDLSRDYEQSKANYESLLAKKMQSSLATSLEKRQQGEQFRIIDPPSLPIKPTSPNRLLWSLGGLVVGLGLAFCATAVLEVLDDRLRGEQDLLETLRLPIIAEIPRLETSAEAASKRFRPLLETTAIATMVTVISASTLFVYFQG